MTFKSFMNKLDSILADSFLSRQISGILCYNA